MTAEIIQLFTQHKSVWLVWAMQLYIHYCHEDRLTLLCWIKEKIKKDKEKERKWEKRAIKNSII